MFYPVTCNVRIVYGVRAFFPTRDNAVFSAGTGRTLVLQPARNGVCNGSPATGAAGMGDVVTLADGSFLLIDGGSYVEMIAARHCENREWMSDEPKIAGDCDGLYALLKFRTPEGKKPVTAAWLFTHAHGDHVDFAGHFLGRSKNNVEVRIGAYNFPAPLMNPTKHEKMRF